MTAYVLTMLVCILRSAKLTLRVHHVQTCKTSGSKHSIVALCHAYKLESDMSANMKQHFQGHTTAMLWRSTNYILSIMV